MSVRARLTIAALTGALAFTTAACGGASADPTAGPAVDISAAPTIEVVDNAFGPVHAEVAPGTTVVWSWEETSAQHNVVGDDFSSPLQDSGTFEHTFDQAGTYAFHCTVHGRMRGAVTVAGD